MARRDGAGERSVEALLERERELAEIWELLERAGSGSGSLLVLEGPAGIGKTSLVRAAHALARERGFCVLSARGSDLELGFRIRGCPPASRIETRARPRARGPP
jgi:hypothetical protein